MNLQVDPKPYTLIESLQIPFKGALKGTLITTHEPPSRRTTAPTEPKSRDPRTGDPTQRLNDSLKTPRVPLKGSFKGIYKGSLKGSIRVSFKESIGFRVPRDAKTPLIKEYTLSCSRIPKYDLRKIPYLRGIP